MTTPSPYGQPANPDPYGTGYNQPVYPGAGQPYAQPANPGPYNQPVHPAAVQPYVPVAYVQPVPVAVAVGPYVVPKSKTTAALLAFFLGTIGAHNFYRGQVGRGFGHIALVVVAIICAITAVAMAADAANLPVYASPPGSQRRVHPHLAGQRRERALGVHRVHYDPRVQRRLAPVGMRRRASPGPPGPAPLGESNW